MNKKWILIIVVVSFLGYPFAWIQERGNSIKTFDIFNYDFSYMFFDFAIWAINFFILFFICKLLSKKKWEKRETRKV